MRRVGCIGGLLAVLIASGAQAQTARPKPDTPRQAPAPATPAAPTNLEVAAPPYEAPLLRLSELLGALAYLRDLCGFSDGNDFRTRMSALLDSEASAGPRRERIAGYFNRGFREYELMHRACTPVSREVVRRAMDEAGTLARDIGTRYGGT